LTKKSWWICSLLLAVVMAGSGEAASTCDVAVDFFVISDDGLLLKAGFLANVMAERKLEALEERARANVLYLNRIMRDGVRFCLGKYVLLGVSDIKDFAPLGIESKFWEEIERAAKTGTVSPTQKVRAKQEARRICGVASLLIGQFVDFLPRSDGADLVPIATSGAIGVLKENPVKVVIDRCELVGRSLAVKDTPIGPLAMGSIMDLLTLVAQKIVGPVGRTIFKEYAVFDGRKNEKGFLQAPRRGIQIYELLGNEDETLVHEMGHYLGLAHTSGVLPCEDNDLAESGVSDTPAMNGSRDDAQYSQYFGLPKSKWPRSCGKAVVDSAGNLDDTMPLDNIMTQGSGRGLTLRFTDGQLNVMKKMSGLLAR